MKKRRVFFICNNLKGGGAERMILNILQHLDPDKFEVYLVLFEQEGIHLNFLPPHVNKIFFNRKGKMSYIKIILTVSYKLFSGLKPDIVVSFMILPNILTLVSSLLSFIKPKIVISIRNNPKMDFINQRFRTIKKILMYSLYPFANHMIVVSEGVKKSLVKYFKFNEDKIKVVYNGVNIDSIEKLAREKPDDIRFDPKGSCYYVTACGRLNYQKGFPYLIKAFSRIANRIKAKLFIIGEGEERESLTTLIKNLNMENMIFLTGYKANPFQYIARSDIFVLSSLFEGFPNIIGETMVCGTPIISTDCPFGPDEIIEHGINGILIPPRNIDILADTLLTLLKDKSYRDRLSLAGKKRVKEFSVLKMVSGYEAVLDESD